MILKRYMTPGTPKAIRLAAASLTLASCVALPFSAWPEDPLPPIDPIWNRAKIEPERKKKTNTTVTNTATRATVGTSADKKEILHNETEETPKNKTGENSESKRMGKSESNRENRQMTFDVPEKEELKVDVVKASDFPTYLKAAEGGDTEGMRLTGICYLYGTGVGKDERKAWEWFGKSASAGNQEAQYNLGCLYRDGQGVRQNYEEAAYWYRRAARNGNPKAMVNIARQFAEGQGVLQDYRIAAENFWRAAEHGEPEGMYQYAVMLRDGIGVQQDNAKALRWFREAAKSDYKDSSLQAEQLAKTVKPAVKAGKTNNKRTNDHNKKSKRK